MANTFVCNSCGEEFPLWDLSQESLNAAGTDNKQTALLILRGDVTCRYCQDEIEEIVGETWAPRNTVERWEFSGIRLDPGMKVFYNLNY